MPSTFGQTIEMVVNQYTLIYLGGPAQLEEEFDAISLVPAGGVGVVSPAPLAAVGTLNPDTGLRTVTLMSSAPSGSSSRATNVSHLAFARHDPRDRPSGGDGERGRPRPLHGGFGGTRLGASGRSSGSG